MKKTAFELLDSGIKRHQPSQTAWAFVVVFDCLLELEGRTLLLTTTYFRYRIWRTLAGTDMEDFSLRIVFHNIQSVIQTTKGESQFSNSK